MLGFGAGLVSAQETTSGPAAEEKGAEPGLQEIVVTAEKRKERLQDVPIAITAITGDTLDRAGARNISDLTASTPNVNFQPVSVVPSGAITFIRGIGERSVDPLVDQPNAINIDGVYIQGSHGALFDTFDLDRVEVLRGPQGTLQGRNATGGAINLFTRRPSLAQMRLRGEVDYGRFNTWTAKAAVDGPLMQDKLAAKLAVMSTDSDGYVRNVFAGGHSGGRKYTDVRFGILYTPTSNFDVYLSGDYVIDNSQQTPAHNVTDASSYPRSQTGGQGLSLLCSAFAQCTPDPHYVVRSDYTARNYTHQALLSLTANWQLDAVTLTSVTGYKRLPDHVRLDLDFTPLSFLRVQDQYTADRTWSQEVRVASNNGGGLDMSGRLNWVAGVYYLNDKWDFVEHVCLPILGVTCDLPDAIRGQTLRSYAAFAHADYKLTDSWDLFAGGRYTNDKKDYEQAVPAPVAGHRSWGKANGEAGARFHISPDTMAYVRFAQGYRSGGFNNTGQTYDPETVNAWEIGLKSLEWNRRLSVNAAIFHYDYKDLQRDVVGPSNTPPFYVEATRNAAKAKIDGAELEATAVPLADLTLRASIGYLNAKYDKYVDNVVGAGGALTPVDNSALRLPYSPKWTTSAGGDYTVHTAPAELTLSANYQYRTRFTTNPGDLPVGAQSGYGLLNASLRLAPESQHYSVTLYGENLTDRYYIVAGENNGGLNLYQVEGMPRTYGLRVTAQF
jgi:iron complex outermembrane receptor protein